MFPFLLFQQKEVGEFYALEAEICQEKRQVAVGVGDCSMSEVSVVSCDFRVRVIHSEHVY